MMDKHIYLVRHGDIDVGEDKRYIGQLDLPLSPLGVKQAAILKEIFSRISLDKIYCSDLRRAQQTAEIVASVHSAIPAVCPDLRELNMGDWEGKLFSEIKAEYPEKFRERGADIANSGPPGGESFADCYKRVIPSFEKFIQSSENTILIVGHAGVNRVILCHVLKLALHKVFCFKQDYGCINLISKKSSEYYLRFLNYSESWYRP